MVDSIKPNADAAFVMPKVIHPSGTAEQTQNFGDFIKTDIKDFINKSQQVEGLLNNYVQGIGDMEEIAPKFKELMLEFELKTKIVSSLANMIKNLTSIQI